MSESNGWDKLIRLGKVTSCDPTTMRARVTFSDRESSAGELTSAALPILTLGTETNKIYSNIDIGTTVVCCFLGNDTDGTGFILGCVSTDKTEMKGNSMDITRMDLGESISVEFDRASGNTTLKVKGKLTIEAGGDIRIEGKNIYLN